MQHALKAIFLLVSFELLLHLLESKETSVYPSFSLPKQTMHCLNRVNLCIGVRQISHVKSFFMDTHTKNSILSKENVLVIKHLLFRLRINIDTARIDEIWE